ncbi:MAG: glycosyltransferase family 2 protein [Selenomonadaceae bacterium]|nr:glycosyltransferase family 2 protein [Selenomonadaceae bacterium]MBR0103248.1 glycosyltransferase family 2 protein [Selenomonadaceae bacterium]
MNCGLIIPTLNAGEQFRTLLTQLAAQSLPTRKLIVDSESTDGTAQLAKSFGLEVLTIPRKTFNHGATRQLALEKILPLDVIIFLTQDVLLHDGESLARLVEVFSDDSTVGMSYGRQLPHADATNEAAILRAFNYPAESQLRSFDDRKLCGLKTAFASNSFAAYRVSALQRVGGFPSKVPLCEDMYVAAKMLLDGWKIFYAAAAQVYHSHNYTAAQEFRRYVQIGKFHAQESWIRETFGSAEGAGKKFVLMKLSMLAKKNPLDCVGAIFRDAAKFLGYRIGRLTVR